jgi:hypothetical protein
LKYATEKDCKIPNSYDAYVLEIEMPDAAVQRVKSLLHDFSSVIVGRQKLFITDTYDGESVRRFQNLWIFSKTHIMECKNVLVSDDIDLVSLSDISYLSVDKADISEPYKDSTIKSKYSVIVNFAGTLRAQLEAANNNCKHLHSVVLEYFLPNLLERSGPDQRPRLYQDSLLMTDGPNRAFQWT